MSPLVKLDIPPSKRLDTWVPDAPFRDSIAVHSIAPGPRLLRAMKEVTLREMPLALVIGRIRYLPALFGSADAAHRLEVEIDRPFWETLVRDGSNLVLEEQPDEIILGSVGKLHQIRDQQQVPLKSPAEFRAFHAPDHEKLAMSVRVLPGAAGQTLLVLEHRTLPTDEDARHRFARYWRVIRPGGVFVTDQLLRAVARRAEQSGRATMQTISPA